MGPRFNVTTLLVLALVLGAADARANGARSSSLGWVRGPGAESCIGTRALAQAVEARLGHPIFVSAARADVAIEGQIDRDPAGAWRAGIAIAGEHGAVLGTRELRSEAADCRDLDAQLALVIAVMIDPDAALRAPPLPAASPVPVAAPIPPTPAVVHSEAAPRLPAPRSDPWLAGLQGGAIFAFGLLPSASAGFAVRGRFVPPRWPAFELGATIWLPNQAESNGVGARFSLAEGFVSVCPLARSAGGLDLGACLGVRGGALRVGGFGYDLDEEHERPTLGATLEGRVRRRIVGPLVLDLRPGLLVPFIRDRFYFAAAGGRRLDVFRMSPLGGIVEAAVGVEIP